MPGIGAEVSPAGIVGSTSIGFEKSGFLTMSLAVVSLPGFDSDAGFTAGRTTSIVGGIAGGVFDALVAGATNCPAVDEALAAGSQIGSEAAAGSVAEAWRMLDGNAQVGSFWDAGGLPSHLLSAATAEPARMARTKPASLTRKRFMPTRPHPGIHRGYGEALPSISAEPPIYPQTFSDRQDAIFWQRPSQLPKAPIFCPA
jgi:hypothetical protein